MNTLNDYVISCCSTADLTEEHFSQRNIQYINFHFSINDKNYIDDLGKTISYDEFYMKMAEGAVTKTSQVNSDEFINYFEGFLKNGNDILHVCLSSGLSGVINSATIAKNELESKYPERKIYIIDSLGASSGYGLIMDKLADLRDEGKSIDEAKDWIEEHKLELHHWFFSTDLSFYVRGGRISKAEGWFGTLLNICPLLNMDDTGHLIPRLKLRGKKRVFKEIVNKMVDHAKDGVNYSDKCYISQSACYEDAKLVADMVEEEFPHLKGKVEINHVGTTIGCHTGPGTVALFFWGDKRTK
ncbi:MAG: DegV family protein [Clostridiales bacterium]|nr:DegV family protein [Clostridiales bacterium]